MNKENCALKLVDEIILNLYINFFLKYVYKIQVTLKSDNNNGRALYSCDVISLNSS